MGSANIYWDPGTGGNIVSQSVQYRLHSDLNWITVISGLSPQITAYSIDELNDNTLYDFRVLSICALGGITESSIQVAVKWVDPVVTASATHNTISYSFPDPGGSVSGYSVELLASNGTTVVQTLTTRTGTFDSGSISASTTYYIKTTLFAGTIPHVCAPYKTITTQAIPTCIVPTGLTAAFS